MAATSGIVNIVKFTSLAYAASPSDATAPTTLTTVTDDQLKDGTFNIDIPKASLTSDYLESGKVYGVRVGNVDPKISIGLALATAKTISDLSEGTSLTAGTAGTTADKLKLGSGTPTAKYLYILATGLNSDGEEIKVEAFKARPTYSWSGNMGRNQEPAPFTVEFSLLYHPVADCFATIEPKF